MQLLVVAKFTAEDNVVFMHASGPLMAGTDWSTCDRAFPTQQCRGRWKIDESLQRGEANNSTVEGKIHTWCMFKFRAEAFQSTRVPEPHRAHHVE